MAHSCPDCGSYCHCNGDIDDIDFGDDSPEATQCRHCDCPRCNMPKGMCDCDPHCYYDEEDEDTAAPSPSGGPTNGTAAVDEKEKAK